ncbi:M48 family metallopeptidase [Ramlibacter albus]|uniref:M48 family metalloprotease n=1 Tax=Ramlibacter albus TaxID=2079448 RepID=A0A923M947_9BURK|nr:M48 family metallopeptidase [Ramlibacter albus]MBC5766572.1 M48 family metalloprotease [Ramlibacter albus]
MNARRSFLRSTCRHCLGLASMLGLPAMAENLTEGGTLKVPPRFARPATDTDEGGLWALVDREEARIRRSPLAIRDEPLKKYLTDLTCGLADGHCPDIRVHIVRIPQFNASMAPNGMMLVWSGLLLRAENEAQLAAVLGHEMGHYLEKHSVEQLRTAKDRAVLATLVGMIGGVASTIGQIGIIASMFAFSREHETRADRLGMKLMQQAGYDGRQAAQVWENLLGELKVTGGDDVGHRSAMFATHPPAGNRRDDLLKLAGEKGGSLNAAEYRKAIAPLRFDWIGDEIKRGQYEESLILFDRMLARDKEDVEVLYARGEVYRLREEKDDMAKALDDLTRATMVIKAPAEAFRSLGLVHKARSDKASAVPAFEKYLEMTPDAPDASLIKTYIAEMKA